MANEYLNNKDLEKAIIRFQQCKRDIAKYEAVIARLQNNPRSRIRKFKGRGFITNKNCIEQYEKVKNEYFDLKNILAVAFFTLSDNLARYKNISYIDIDDAVQEGVIVCFEKIDRFNPDKGKSFSYFTQIIINQLLQMYRAAKNYGELKNKYQNHLRSKDSQGIIENLKRRGIYKENNFSEFS